MFSPAVCVPIAFDANLALVIPPASCAFVIALEGIFAEVTASFTIFAVVIASF
jgi:hypothetical protein